MVLDLAAGRSSLRAATSRSATWRRRSSATAFGDKIGNLPDFNFAVEFVRYVNFDLRHRHNLWRSRRALDSQDFRGLAGVQAVPRAKSSEISRFKHARSRRGGDRPVGLTQRLYRLRHRRPGASALHTIRSPPRRLRSQKAPRQAHRLPRRPHPPLHIARQRAPRDHRAGHSPQQSYQTSPRRRPAPPPNPRRASTPNPSTPTTTPSGSPCRASFMNRASLLDDRQFFCRASPRSA
jgi:hypothetical protein